MNSGLWEEIINRDKIDNKRRQNNSEKVIKIKTKFVVSLKNRKMFLSVNVAYRYLFLLKKNFLNHDY